jgi:DNA-directed RNA polymerase subunit M/transcription elongation factor TFIIS
MFRVIMENANPADEYRRLEELYAEMSDSRLQDMAEQADDLTPLAQQVLRAEVSKRGLDKHVPDAPVENSVVSEDDLIRVHVAEDSAEAQSVINLLETAGIRTCLSTEKIEFADRSFEDKPVVKVVYLDRSRALSLLSEYFPSQQGEDTGGLPVCPGCHSPDITFQSLDTERAPGGAAQFNWTCEACGNQWRDDGLEQLA